MDEVMDLEADSRFPSGPWTGFFLQPDQSGKGWMELDLSFRAGTIRGEGRDRVGPFVVSGRYDVMDGRCHWRKSYLGEHSLDYSGYNEGQGIWGLWEYAQNWKGGFRIWPVGMADPTLRRSSEGIDEPDPTPVDWMEPQADPSSVGEPVGSEVGGPLVI